jgi:hypothetical protein
MVQQQQRWPHIQSPKKTKMPKDTFGKELEAAHREEMWKLAGWLIPATVIALGLAIGGVMYVHATYYDGGECETCLDNANDTWDCDTVVGGGWTDDREDGKTQKACRESRAAEIADCMKLCGGEQ